MVLNASSYKTLLFGCNKKEGNRDNNDNNNAERRKGCLAPNVCANQCCDGQFLSGALGLFSINNGEDNNNNNNDKNKGENKEAYHIAKNLLYRINSNNEDLMGSREKNAVGVVQKVRPTISNL